MKQTAVMIKKTAPKQKAKQSQVLHDIDQAFQDFLHGRFKEV